LADKSCRIPRCIIYFNSSFQLQKWTRTWVTYHQQDIGACHFTSF
jgi:hypothetical protein